DAFVADDVIFDFEVQFGLRRILSLRVVDLVSEFRIASLFQREISLRGYDFHVLESVGVRGRNPNANIFSRRHVFHREGVVKREVARVLGEAGKGEGEERGECKDLSERKRLPSSSSQ